MTKTKIHKRYCRECGCQMEMSIILADKVDVWHDDSSGGCMFRLDNPFDSKTGIRNMAEKFECPNSKRFFNQHDIFVIYEDEKHWL